MYEYVNYMWENLSMWHTVKRLLRSIGMHTDGHHALVLYGNGIPQEKSSYSALLDVLIG